MTGGTICRSCYVVRNTLPSVETRPHGLDFIGFSLSSVHMDGLDSMQRVILSISDSLRMMCS